MLPPNRNSSASGPAPKNGLESVIEIERRLGEVLAEANREGARITAAARLAAQEAEARAELDIAEPDRELRARIERGRERVIGEIAAAAAVDASRFDAIDGTRVGELAAYVVSRLVAPLPDRSR